jgi:hypothetical protein
LELSEVRRPFVRIGRDDRAGFVNSIADVPASLQAQLDALEGCGVTALERGVSQPGLLVQINDLTSPS